MNKYILGASSDIGYQREHQEDFVQYREIDEKTLIAIIADGTGSTKEHIQPAVMASMSVLEELTDLHENALNLFERNPLYFIHRAMKNANDKLGVLKMGSEELYSGYACSMTVAYFDKNSKIFIGHAGNTRLYIIRNGILTQITTDHTKAQELLDNGMIDINTYHIHPDRLALSSGLGMILNPQIQTLSCSFKENDIVLMSTDGVHYAIRQDAIINIILESADCLEASKNLISAARDIVKYPDNVSAIIIR